MSKNYMIEPAHPRYRHTGTGGLYEHVADGRSQNADRDHDDVLVVIYREVIQGFDGEKLGSFWVQPYHEFHDGPFERVEDGPAKPLPELTPEPTLTLAEVMAKKKKPLASMAELLDAMGDDGEDDPVNHPAHYTSHPSGTECIEITEHMGFCLGNALKYIWRADLKGDSIQDLEKAAWYINREIAKRKAQ